MSKKLTESTVDELEAKCKPEPTEFTERCRRVIARKPIADSCYKWMGKSCDIIESQAAEITTWQERQQWYHDKACELQEQLAAKDKEIEGLKNELLELSNQFIEKYEEWRRCDYGVNCEAATVLGWHKRASAALKGEGCRHTNDEET